MDRLKIECKTKKEKKEAIKLLVALGYGDYGTKDKYLLLKTYSDGSIVTTSNLNNSGSCTLITIQQLRDMVALKNNNVHDNNYIDEDEQEWYITEDGQRYIWNRELNKWSLEMDNLKIRVANEAESREAQELFFELGFSWAGEKAGEFWETRTLWIYAKDHNKALYGGSVSTDTVYKEITITELRDLVVLKRNDVGDSTHIANFKCDEQFFVSSNNEVYIWWGGSHWEKSGIKLKELKPIEKTMKEYLNKSTGEYKKTDGVVSGDNWVEIPKGSIKATLYAGYLIFWKDDFFCLSLRDGDTDFTYNKNDDYSFDEYISLYGGIECVIWQRATQPEELPFIDDEVVYKNSFSEENTADVSAWDKQEGGAHYKNLKIQPMQYALENKLDYAQANVVKYVTRHASKNGKEDLLKAIHNIELMIDYYYSQEAQFKEFR